MHQKAIQKYYDQLASTYDENRFSNSYGQYIDAQERKFLTSFFTSVKRLNKTLDLGCGTGRLLDFATSGVDFSEEMLSQAKAKYPYKNLTVGNITDIPFENESMYCIFSFHVIMHQDRETTQLFLSESWQKLKPEGFLIFDFPVKRRRKIMLLQKAGMLITASILRKLNFYSGINGLLPRPTEFYFSRYTAFQNLYEDYFFLWTIGFAAPF